MTPETWLGMRVVVVCPIVHQPVDFGAPVQEPSGGGVHVGAASQGCQLPRGGRHQQLPLPEGLLQVPQPLGVRGLGDGCQQAQRGPQLIHVEGTAGQA